jgi:hypothetical protein
MGKPRNNTAQSCWDSGVDSLMQVGGDDPDDYDAIYCAGCGARGKVDESVEPTNGGSYYYICGRTGAGLGWSGI